MTNNEPEASYPGRILQYSASIGLSAIVLAFVICVVISSLVMLYPHALDGAEHIKPGDGREPNFFRNFLENLSFLANFFFFVTAICALNLARKHAEHAGRLSEEMKTTGLAIKAATESNLHRHLFDRLETKEIRDGLAICREIVVGYDGWNGMFPSPLSSYAVEQLRIWENDDPDKMRVVLEFLDDLEEIGLSVRRGYFLMDDAYDMFEGSLRLIDSVFQQYLDEARPPVLSPSGDHHLCEHTRWLLAKRRDGYVRSQPLAP